MSYERKENNLETEEGLSADEAKVRELLAGMKRVEAPKNFDFKLQARIANTRPENLRAAGGSWAFLRYAAPLALVLAVVSGFVINGLYTVNNDSVPEVATQKETALPVRVEPSTAPTEKEIAGSSLLGGSNPAAVNSDPESIKKQDEEATAGNPRRPSGKDTANSRGSGGGSLEFGLGNRKPIIQPPDAVARRNPGGGAEAGGQIAIRRILEIVGIDADASDQGWKVKSIDSHSVAERSGVKAGDLIEAINGLPVTDGTQFSGVFNGKNLRVRRGGATLEIDLK